MKTSTSRRSIKMGDMIMREIATMLIEDVADPRLELVSISGVRLNKDLKFAEVLFTLSGDKERIASAQQALQNAAGYMRSTLSKRMRVRQVPQLTFIHDNFLEEMVYGKPIERDLPDS
jgi:ribosome-binding factor A